MNTQKVKYIPIIGSLELETMLPDSVIISCYTCNKPIALTTNSMSEMRKQVFIPTCLPCAITYMRGQTCLNSNA